MSYLEQVKQLREKTGAGVVEAKKALDEANGNEERAMEILRQRGQAKALKKADREAKEGIIEVYVHPNKKVAAMVKLLCETDFVGRNEEFQELARDLAMHVAAMGPRFVKPEDVPVSEVEKERAAWTEQLKAEGKPEDILGKIMAGKEKKFREERAFLTQPFVKDPDKTVESLIAEKIGKIGEKIEVGEFVRYEL
jgi:elongation factor Ts